MKVLLINGSPHKKGCVFTALSEVESALNGNGIDTEIFHIGDGPTRGCSGCMNCERTQHCLYNEDGLNECVDKLIAADGLVVGSPVYFAGPNGALCAFLDRLFFQKFQFYAQKPAAAIVNCRRGGAASAFDRLNKYFTISRMPLVSSQYWNSTHGMTPEEVRQDIEGLQTMRTLGNQMAWMLRAIAKEGTASITAQAEPFARLNFIH